MATTLTYDYMPGLDSGMSGYGGGSNEDLNDLLDLSQAEGSTMDGMFDFGGESIFTPNGMNINGGMMASSFAGNQMLQPQPIDASAQYANPRLPSYDPNSSGFPFTQQVDPAIIMGAAQSSSAGRQSNAVQSTSSGSTQVDGSIPAAQDSSVSVKHSQEPEDAQAPKPKRTRVSKKKKLTPEQEEKKRKEFLERNRQAASKCRSRKQDANAALQEKVSNYSHANEIMKAEVAVLREMVADLKQSLLSHTNCADPDLKAGVERLLRDNDSPATPHSAQSFGSMPGQSMGASGTASPEMDIDAMNSSPATPSWNMQRLGSGISTLSQDPYDHYLNNTAIPPQALITEQERFTEHKEYKSEYESTNMAAQGNYKTATSLRSSRSSEGGSRSPSSDHENSGYASTTTTPEDSTKDGNSPIMAVVKIGMRRGIPQKALQNPRTELFINPLLPGVSPSDHLAHQ